ncbi:DNA-binding CsgD family transcriptional regulator [Pseudomonas sp. WPR_5_2]|uniref:LuxR family transcriptional regulator n=1 Tax=Pseudomonas sp. WPR_5_2 TaxID=1907371 RepID=UPI000F2A871D|nr:LuxR family transcriptional regulator [Pseudomonas sp. WPR_5_2]RKS27179.1 DNA-binding CsgD family transcriptional regulator [Pseudomonas sp. WPR_5_2]
MRCLSWHPKDGRAYLAIVEQDDPAAPAIIDDLREIPDMFRADSATVTSSSSPAHLKHPETERPAAVTLTAREKEVLRWSAIGKSSWEIGRIFNCTEAGVNYHFANIRRKFGVSSRGCAVVKALELGLIELP